jgi:GntR family transcriptional regulator
LQTGDKLPSVRELAGQLAINPNTIQRAYRELEMQGWIATVAGKGCFVCGVPAEEHRENTLLADFDKIVAALQSMGYTREELMSEYMRKHEARGGFSQKIFLISKG